MSLKRPAAGGESRKRDSFSLFFGNFFQAFDMLTGLIVCYLAAIIFMAVRQSIQV